jgi:hypothetical protein
LPKKDKPEVKKIMVSVAILQTDNLGDGTLDLTSEYPRMREGGQMPL